LRAALALLSQAGYDLDGTVMRNRATRQPLSFEILATTRDQERIALAYLRDLAARASLLRFARSMPCNSSASAQFRFGKGIRPMVLRPA